MEGGRQIGAELLSLGAAAAAVGRFFRISILQPGWTNIIMCHETKPAKLAGFHATVKQGGGWFRASLAQAHHCLGAHVLGASELCIWCLAWLCKVYLGVSRFSLSCPELLGVTPPYPWYGTQVTLPLETCRDFELI